MTDWFYSLPIWVVTIMIVGASLAIGLAASHGVQKVLRLKVNAEEREVAINLMQVVAAYVGIMIAFAGVQVWQDFNDADHSVAQEAATAMEFYQDLTIFGPETVPARQALRTYVVSVVKDEWPQLSKGRGSHKSEEALHNVFNEIGKLNPTDNRAAAIYSEMLTKVNDLINYRRDRIEQSQAGIPANIMGDRPCRRPAHGRLCLGLHPDPLQRLHDRRDRAHIGPAVPVHPDGQLPV